MRIDKVLAFFSKYGAYIPLVSTLTAAVDAVAKKIFGRPPEQADSGTTTNRYIRRLEKESWEELGLKAIPIVGNYLAIRWDHAHAKGKQPRNTNPQPPSNNDKINLQNQEEEEEQELVLEDEVIVGKENKSPPQDPLPQKPPEKKEEEKVVEVKPPPLHNMEPKKGVRPGFYRKEDLEKEKVVVKQEPSPSHRRNRPTFVPFNKPLEVNYDINKGLENEEEELPFEHEDIILKDKTDTNTPPKQEPPPSIQENKPKEKPEIFENPPNNPESNKEDDLNKTEVKSALPNKSNTNTPPKQEPPPIKEGKSLNDFQLIEEIQPDDNSKIDGKGPKCFKPNDLIDILIEELLPFWGQKEKVEVCAKAIHELTRNVQRLKEPLKEEVQQIVNDSINNVQELLKGETLKSFNNAKINSIQESQIPKTVNQYASDFSHDLSKAFIIIQKFRAIDQLVDKINTHRNTINDLKIHFKPRPKDPTPIEIEEKIKTSRDLLFLFRPGKGLFLIRGEEIPHLARKLIEIHTKIIEEIQNHFTPPPKDMTKGIQEKIKTIRDMLSHNTIKSLYTDDLKTISDEELPTFAKKIMNAYAETIQEIQDYYTPPPLPMTKKIQQKIGEIRKLFGEKEFTSLYNEDLKTIKDEAILNFVEQIETKINENYRGTLNEMNNLGSKMIPINKLVIFLTSPGFKELMDYKSYALTAISSTKSAFTRWAVSGAVWAIKKTIPEKLSSINTLIDLLVDTAPQWDERNIATSIFEFLTFIQESTTAKQPPDEKTIKQKTLAFLQKITQEFPHYEKLVEKFASRLGIHK